ncbi:MAG: hypothetical protein RQ966_15380 [Acetobacteraceae bacterium]|nr:hypothetical protein [Acetobacteraceae bacterium]
MPQKKMTVADHARARAALTLADGKPILERAILLQCADAIDGLRKALEEIAEQSPARGGIWARRRAEEALDPED